MSVHHTSPSQVLTILQVIGRPASRREMETWACCTTHLIQSLRGAKRKRLITAHGYGAGMKYQPTPKEDKTP